MKGLLHRMNRVKVTGLLWAGVALSSAAPAALGGTIVLGGSGWQAQWAPSLDPYVQIVFDSFDGSTLYIQKAAQFIQGPGPGGFPSIPIQFQQIAFPAATRIVINDESIFNSTGVAWTDFHFELVDSGDAVFNPALTNASAGGSGFNTSPFDNQSFGAGNTTFDVNGFGLGPGGTDAIVPNNSGWFPGSGASDGQLYIDVTVRAQQPYTVFTLKETPTPEPATLALLLLGSAMLWRRR